MDVICRKCNSPSMSSIECNWCGSNNLKHLSIDEYYKKQQKFLKEKKIIK